MNDDRHIKPAHGSADCGGQTEDKVYAPADGKAVPDAVHTVEMRLAIEGMHCASCAAKVREALKAVEGVVEVQVALRENAALVRYDAGRTRPDFLCAALSRAGYAGRRATPVAPKEAPAARRGWSSPPWIGGAAASLAVIGFYLGLITLTSNWQNALYQLSAYGGWVAALALGLGVQVGLFAHMRRAMAGRVKGAASGIAASGGMSGVAMALCCSHYLAAILPAIGLPFFSGAVAGLVEYQTAFFAVGVVSNILGLAYMLRLMQKSGLLGFRPVPQL